MDYTILCPTDTATLAVFDPAVLAPRTSDVCDWWTDDFRTVPEVASGQIGLLSLSGDGVYKVRFTDGSLTDSEASYASERVVLGLTVVSGNVFVGPGECLPGEGTFPELTDANDGRFFVSVPPGTYLLELTAIAWDDSPDWYVPPGEPVPIGAPADIVIRIQPRPPDTAFAPPQSEPRVFSKFEGWLFPDLPRQLGPMPGMLLSTTVVRRRDDLVLKPCGPLGYRPILPDMAGLNWNDRILIEVLTVDHEAREFTASLKRCSPVQPVVAAD
jgi:hypothetical protein